jgi:hypothetical protein
LRDQGVDGCILLKSVVKEIDWEAADWIQLAVDGVQLWAAVNTVVSLRVPY